MSDDPVFQKYLAEIPEFSRRVWVVLSDSAMRAVTVREEKIQRLTTELKTANERYNSLYGKHGELMALCDSKSERIAELESEATLEYIRGCTATKEKLESAQKGMVSVPVGVYLGVCSHIEAHDDLLVTMGYAMDEDLMNEFLSAKPEENKP